MLSSWEKVRSRAAAEISWHCGAERSRKSDIRTSSNLLLQVGISPSGGTTEVWQIMNLTGDTHPIHFHLVNVQLIQRQPFTGDPNGWAYSGPPIPPEANELGWKETVRMNPGEITTVIMKFDLPELPTAAMRDAVSPRTGGREYVWHCHILEHEEHDMMRPLIVR
jgi:spore coat protein A